MISAALLTDEGSVHGGGILWPLHGKEHFLNKPSACRRGRLRCYETWSILMKQRERERERERAVKHVRIVWMFLCCSHTAHQSVQTDNLSTTNRSMEDEYLVFVLASDNSLLHWITFLEIPELITIGNICSNRDWMLAQGAPFWIQPWSWSHDQHPCSPS